MTVERPLPSDSKNLCRQALEGVYSRIGTKLVRDDKVEVSSCYTRAESSSSGRWWGCVTMVGGRPRRLSRRSRGRRTEAVRRGF